MGQFSFRGSQRTVRSPIPLLLPPPVPHRTKMQCKHQGVFEWVAPLVVRVCGPICGVDQSQEHQIHQFSQKTTFEAGPMGNLTCVFDLTNRPAAKIPNQMLSPTSWYHFAFKLWGRSRHLPHPLLVPAITLQLCLVFRMLSLVITHCHFLDVTLA